METRANYLIVGIFALASVIGAFGFFAWLAQVQIDRRYAYYDIVFDSVSGLSRAGDVRFSGLSVGQVVSLDLYEDDPSKVAVRVEIAAETPIRADTDARLQAQGLTGVAFVSLTGGSANAPLLQPGDDGAVPVIFAERSMVQALTEDAPALLLEAIGVMRSLSALANPENQANLSAILADVRGATKGAAGLAAQAEKVLASADRAFLEAAEAAEAAQRTMDEGVRLIGAADRVLTDELSPALADLRTAAERLDDTMAVAAEEGPAIAAAIKAAAMRARDAAGRVDAAVAASAGPVSVFAAEGLPQYEKFAREARVLVDTLRRLAARMERDPARFFFGDRPNEFGR